MKSKIYFSIAVLLTILFILFLMVYQCMAVDLTYLWLLPVIVFLELIFLVLAYQEVNFLKTILYFNLFMLLFLFSAFGMYKLIGIKIAEAEQVNTTASVPLTKSNCETTCRAVCR